MSLEIVFLAIAGLLIASLLIALGAQKLGIPTLVAFLFLGMIMGSDGIIGLNFENAELAHAIGTIGLVLILFEGGLSTSWRRLRNVAVPATLLSTVGVIVTAVLTGAAAYYIFDLPFAYALILGAVVSSTDAAAVFATVRTTNIRRRLARLLEAESGINDPTAIALTIGFISLVEIPGYSGDDMVWLLVKLLGIGLAMGLFLGLIATRVFSRLPHSIGAFAPVASLAAGALAFGLTELIGGSGFLAVYLVGLAIGSTPSRYRSQLTSFHEGLAYLAQVLMFIVLGLLVFPNQLLDVAGASILLALLLIFIIRPLSVFVSIPFNKFNLREQAFVGWAGLRGAVPIILATFVLSSDIEHSQTIFNTVFFIVLVSAVVQGSSLQWVAERLGVVDKLPLEEHAAKDRIEQTAFKVLPQHSIVGSHVSELGLPRQASIDHIHRRNKDITVDRATTVRSGDMIYVSLKASLHPELEDVFTRWRRRI